MAFREAVDDHHQQQIDVLGILRPVNEGQEWPSDKQAKPTPAIPRTPASHTNLANNARNGGCLPRQIVVTFACRPIAQSASRSDRWQ